MSSTLDELEAEHQREIQKFSVIDQNFDEHVERLKTMPLSDEVLAAVAFNGAVPRTLFDLLDVQSIVSARDHFMVRATKLQDQFKLGRQELQKLSVSAAADVLSSLSLGLPDLDDIQLRLHSKLKAHDLQLTQMERDLVEITEFNLKSPPGTMADAFSLQHKGKHSAFLQSIERDDLAAKSDFNLFIQKKDERLNLFFTAYSSLLEVLRADQVENLLKYCKDQVEHEAVKKLDLISTVATLPDMYAMCLTEISRRRLVDAEVVDKARAVAELFDDVLEDEAKCREKTRAAFQVCPTLAKVFPYLTLAPPSITVEMTQSNSYERIPAVDVAPVPVQHIPVLDFSSLVASTPSSGTWD